jgi:hypothetical protein
LAAVGSAEAATVPRETVQAIREALTAWPELKRQQILEVDWQIHGLAWCVNRYLTQGDLLTAIGTNNENAEAVRQRRIEALRGALKQNVSAEIGQLIGAIPDAE